jgi:hypothetical protein
MDNYFRHCSICKKPIAFGANYFQCSVSTCNQKRTALYFCSVSCWDAHVPGARHRDAWAEPTRAPLAAADDSDGTPDAKREAGPAERRIVGPRSVAEPTPSDSDEILVVVSKVKKYISDTAEMNTSSQGMSVLSAHLRRVCDAAVSVARQDGRKTVLDRDFEQAIRVLTARS